jgi:hypothetical protein
VDCVTRTQVGVSAGDGWDTLSGAVDGFPESLPAERTTLRVGDVHRCDESRLRDGPGFAVAVTDIRATNVRAHLIGQLGDWSAALLTEALEPLHARGTLVDGAVGAVLLIDTSALTFVDRTGLCVLGLNRLLLCAAGWTVTSARPNGPDVRLVNYAALAGWAATDPHCTDILHWRPRSVDLRRCTSPATGGNRLPWASGMP